MDGPRHSSRLALRFQGGRRSEQGDQEAARIACSKKSDMRRYSFNLTALRDTL
jgi:hypothetical protein